MKHLIILTMAILSFCDCFSQHHTVKMQIKYGSSQSDLQSILMFENIALNGIKLSGENLINKHYEISIKEYIDGKLVKSEKLFESSESSYFKIDSDSFHFRSVSKLTEENTFKLQFQFDGFRTKSYSFALLEDASVYAVKDFLGAQSEVEVPLQKEFNLLALLTPTMHADGSSSYCEVAQSAIKAEELGIHFKLPHYFLIVMEIK